MPNSGAVQLRAMTPTDWPEVSELVCVSTNFWYQSRGKPAAFPNGPTSTRLFCEVYETLDPGCCIVAVEPSTRRLMGSCFYHPRETHVSLGIMNVHPDYFGLGVAGRLLRFVTDFADRAGKPTRLVSSAMNLDSFSLYTRTGFVPRAAFQDMFLPVPECGLRLKAEGAERVRVACDSDVGAIADLEMQLCHISREKDYRHFLRNAEGIWHLSVSEDVDGKIDGFLASVNHPGSNMLGPGVARTPAIAAALIAAELGANRGRSPVFLVPADCPALVQQMYQWGAKNCEIHFCQVRGKFEPFDGIVMPTFMPETG